MTDHPTYLSTRQAAELLGLSPRTLERYRGAGEGPPFMKMGRQVRYARVDLDDWMEEGRLPPGTVNGRRKR
ncbi:MAG: helix-turn-helix domain-containing protein [Rhodospirillaceae bacterium]|nr:helix-turn-helix domain-containing protein [Rhodospirillaceae bacterium]